MKYNRLREMRELFLQQKKVSTLELCEHFNISSETARRDLNVLEEEGVIEKVYGGAILADNNATPEAMAEWNVRCKVSEHEKAGIARAAIDYVEDDSIIVLDSGTTIFRLAQLFHQKKNLTVLTNSLHTAMEVSASTSHMVYSIGGTVKKGEMIATGFLAVDFLDHFRKIDLALISADGFTVEEGISDHSVEMGNIKKIMVQKSERVIALVDHTKFGQEAFYNVCNTREIDLLITDRKAPAADLKALRKSGVQVVSV